MVSKFVRVGAYEAENQLELSLRKAFEELEPKLKPPFSLEIPNPEEYVQLNRAILYGILTEPHLAKNRMKYVHAIVTDGYAFFVSLTMNVVNDLYYKLFDSVKVQLIWVVKEMVDVLGVGFDGLFVCLLRQIIGGDFSDENLWLCFELVNLFLSKWNWLIEEEPLVLTSGLYVYLRLLADHCRLSNNEKLESLKQLEIKFCVKMLREHFSLCMKIGRDLVRLLQDLFHVPEFRIIWKDLVLNPGEFGISDFSDISQLYCSRTSSKYFLLRISPEMEIQLRFLLTHVKLGNQKRYQVWFTKKFLFGPGRETLVVDIVRFICCAHHPSNEIIQSDIVPRWAIVGWLLKISKKSYIETNTKLALLYDWLFFDVRVDNIMNVEPAMLLMIYSIPNYIEITCSLLDFLFLLMDNYDIDRKHVILRGVSSAFSMLLKKGVVHSLNVLTSCDAFPHFMKERLRRFLLDLNVGIHNKLQSALLPHSVPPLSLTNMSCLDISSPSLDQQSACTAEVTFNTETVDESVPILNDSFATSGPLFITGENQVLQGNMSILETPTPSPER